MKGGILERLKLNFTLEKMETPGNLQDFLMETPGTFEDPF